MGGAGAAGGMSASEGLRRGLCPLPLVTDGRHHDTPPPLIHLQQAVCSNFVRNKTFNRNKTYLQSAFVPLKTFSWYKIPLLTKITASARGQVVGGSLIQKVLIINELQKHHPPTAQGPGLLPHRYRETNSNDIPAAMRGGQRSWR